MILSELLMNVEFLMFTAESYEVIEAPSVPALSINLQLFTVKFDLGKYLGP